MIVVWALGCARPASAPQTADLEPLEDLDPSPGRFEGRVVAQIAEVRFGDQVAAAATYNGVVPGPLIDVSAGDEVAITFDNELDAGFANTIHWHGIEGNNEADGTPLTQELVGTGGTFEYTFVPPRPGLFWYHPHHRGAQLVYSGLYAPLIVRQAEEVELVAAGILPRIERVLVLSDTQIWDGEILSAEVDNPMVQMNGTEGDTLLVNGVVHPTFEVPAGAGVRLRLVNTSITRFWRLAVPGHTLHVVGGEGGLLDAAHVDGGTVPTELLDPLTGDVVGAGERSLGYERGEVLLGPADRLDVVLVADGSPGDDLVLQWKDWARGRHTMVMDGDQMVSAAAPDDGLRPSVDVATFRLGDPAPVPFVFAEGQDLLAAVGSAVERLPEAADLDWTGAAATTLDERMDMSVDDQGVWQMSSWFGIDGVDWHPEHAGAGTQDYAPTARFAAVGQVARWQLRTRTEMAHPFHLHGFSFQPVSVTWWPDPEHAALDEVPMRSAFTRAAFEDTIVVPGNATVELLVRFDDPRGDGGALGRWMEHCHILQHAELGMASELVIEE